MSAFKHLDDIKIPAHRFPLLATFYRTPEIKKKIFFKIMARKFGNLFRSQPEILKSCEILDIQALNLDCIRYQHGITM